MGNIDNEKCAEDIYLSHSVVSELTGKGLACHLIECLETFGLSRMDIRTNLCGTAFDGQYIKYNVNRKLKKDLNIENKTVPGTWDPMHLLELAQSDSETNFIDSTCQTINAVMKELKMGQSLEFQT